MTRDAKILMLHHGTLGVFDTLATGALLLTSRSSRVRYRQFSATSCVLQDALGGELSKKISSERRQSEPSVRLRSLFWACVAILAVLALLSWRSCTNQPVQSVIPLVPHECSVRSMTISGPPAMSCHAH